jgi:predicted TIM-barrel fold metal-dependent hydrolase
MKQTTAFRRIATEEAFSVATVAEAMRDVVRHLPAANLDLNLLRTIYDNPAEGSTGSELLRRLLDLEDERIRIMDANGVDMHLLSLTSPGVQMFDADTATELAALSNDILRETIVRHPPRFAGLASFAPHSPKRAAKEMDRAVNTLGLQGFIVNSHTNGEYLDDSRFWPILEAAEHLRRPLYIHPRAPSDGMAEPFRDAVDRQRRIRPVSKPQGHYRTHGRSHPVLALADRFHARAGCVQQPRQKDSVETERIFPQEFRHHDKRDGIARCAGILDQGSRS